MLQLIWDFFQVAAIQNVLYFPLINVFQQWNFGRTEAGCTDCVVDKGA